MKLIGGHVSAAGELSLAVDRAINIGANCFQFFISPPQQWMQTKHSETEITDFVTKVQEKGIKSTFIHGTYLVNLATNKPEHLEKSISWLKYAMDLAQRLNVTGVIFHTGSHGGRGFETVIDQIASSINAILSSAVIPPKNELSPYLILENSAGGGGSIGSKFSELGKILKQVIAFGPLRQVEDEASETALEALVRNNRLKICLDTCHAFAAGYDVKTSAGLQKTLEEFDREIGLENLAAIHINDSKFDLGFGKDRHENIGDGFIGKEGFANMINNEHLKNIPFILEVPGFAGTGPDNENIDILRSLVSK